jgi:hypothetical protein
MADTIQGRRVKARSWGRVALRVLLLAIAAVALYLLFPRLVELFQEAPELDDVRWRWFLLMFALMAGAFAAQWELTRIAVPGTSWFVSATSQLTSNAMVKVTPGGPIVAGAVYFQMLSVSGVPMGQAAAALAAVSVLSTMVLFSFPGVAVVLAALSAPIPRGLLPVALAGTVLFLVMLGGAVVLVRYDRPLRWIGWAVERLTVWASQRLGREWKASADGFVARRDEVIEALGARWWKAITMAVLNWLLDYLALVVALLAVGARPRASLVLLAFGAAAVLGMIPITPGGLGFVEVGLTGILTVSGVAADAAALATLAYRLFQFWLPIPAGLAAYLLFRRRYGKLSELPVAGRA